MRLGPARKRGRGNGDDENDSAVHRLVFGRAGPLFRWLRARTTSRSDGLQGGSRIGAGRHLAKEIDSVEDRELRVSRATVGPGGHIGLHSHQGDPTIVYVLEGTLTNHHDDGTTEEFQRDRYLLNLARDRIGLKTTGRRWSPLSPQTFTAGNRSRRKPALSVSA